MNFNFILLDMAVIDKLLTEGYSHMNLQEVVPAQSLKQPQGKDLLIFKPIRIEQGLPIHAVSMRDQNVLDALEQTNRDCYLTYQDMPQIARQGSSAVPLD